jgi:hypothetical protein
MPLFRGFPFAFTEDNASFCDMFSFKENKLQAIPVRTRVALELTGLLKQNKRIAPLSFLHGCHKRRLKD